MAQLLQIAVISDTHDFLPSNLLQRLSDADEIWHLGDVCDPEILRRIRSLEKPIQVVKGNMDFNPEWPKTLELQRNGRTFVLQHKPPVAIAHAVDAHLFGHLHYPVSETRDGTKLLNPGAINGPRNNSVASFAWLKIEENGSWNWQTESLQRYN